MRMKDLCRRGVYYIFPSRITLDANIKSSFNITFVKPLYGSSNNILLYIQHTFEQKNVLIPSFLLALSSLQFSHLDN